MMCESLAGVCAGADGVAAATFAAALQLLAHSQCLLTESWPPQATLHNKSSVDIIIVGSGTAGSALAARLVESNLTVLLLEAGGDPPMDSIVPGFPPSLFQSQYDWNFTTTDHPNSSQELRFPHHRRLHTARMLGGSGSTSYTIYSRGLPGDYDHWADIVGDATWNWNNVFPYFKKTEKMTDKSIFNSASSHYHGYEGEIQVSSLDKQNFDTIKLLDSFAELGFNVVEDRNSPENIGANRAYHLSYTIKDGKRQSTLTAMLNKKAGKKNLHVLKNALVTKIFINNKTAYGVKVLLDSGEWEFYANKEVVVSAGVYNTPKLLMLSGIGPAGHVERSGIHKIEDLPVGANLLEQLNCYIFIAAESGLCHSDEHSAFFDVIKYLYNRTGSLSIPSAMGAEYFLEGSDMPDFGIFPTCVPKGSDYLEQCLKITEFTHDTCSHLHSINKEYELVKIAVILRKPKSRGLVRLASANPLDKPLIYSGAITEEEDLDGFPEVIEVVKTLTNTTYFKSKNAFVVDLEFKSCAGLVWPEDVKCVVKSAVHSEPHAVGTAAMGTVLDSKLRVLGLQSLRVVDASAIPSAIHSSTNAAVIMLAEKAADIIKEDHGLLKHLRSYYKKVRQVVNFCLKQ